MAKNIKITDVVMKFSGENNINAWFDRLKCVSELQGISDLAPIIPMFLDGPAFDVYEQMSPEEKKDGKEIETKLKKAFGSTPSQSYTMFKSRTLSPGESPEAFAAELRRLSTDFLKTKTDDNEAIDNLVLCQFIDGLPNTIQSQVKALQSGGDWSLQTVLACTKEMLQQCGSVNCLIGTANIIPQNFTKICKGCNRMGHTIETCRTRCYGCGGTRHVRRNCPSIQRGSNQGNA